MNAIATEVRMELRWHCNEGQGFIAAEIHSLQRSPARTESDILFLNTVLMPGIEGKRSQRASMANRFEIDLAGRHLRPDDGFALRAFKPFARLLVTRGLRRKAVITTFFTYGEAQRLIAVCTVWLFAQCGEQVVIIGPARRIDLKLPFVEPLVPQPRDHLIVSLTACAQQFADSRAQSL